MNQPIPVSTQLRLAYEGDQFISPLPSESIHPSAKHHGVRIETRKVQVIDGGNVQTMTLVTVLTPGATPEIIKRKQTKKRKDQTK